MPHAPLARAQALHEAAADRGAEHRLADAVQPRLGERGEQHAQRLAERLVAEIGEARTFARLGDQRALVERDCAFGHRGRREPHRARVGQRPDNARSPVPA